jgi:hypothetical protein
VAEGVVIPNKYTVAFPHVKWCCELALRASDTNPI